MGPAILWVALLGALLCQVVANFQLAPLRPAIDEMPYPPSPQAMKALALGDDQFLFRSEISWLQEVGDGGGRLRPLKDYDYGRVINWLREIDRLDPQSQSIFALGSTYFGAITDPVLAPPKVKLLAQFFAEAGAADPAQRWSWLVWSAIKTQHIVRDPDLARSIAGSLLSLPSPPAVPDWLPLLAAPLYRTAGDADKAASLDLDPDMIARHRRVHDNLSARLGWSSNRNP